MKKNLLFVALTLSITLLVIGIIFFLIILFSPTYFNTSFSFDADLAEKFGTFFGGFIGTIFALVSSILLVSTLLYQNIDSQKNEVENVFFKMLDYHRDNVANINIYDYNAYENNKNDKIEGQASFINYKLQLAELLIIVDEINNRFTLKLNKDDVIDIAYVSFHYGISSEWKTFLEKLFKKYNNDTIVNELIKYIDLDKKNYKKNTGRTNQTFLGNYFRNMYNIIKYIDDSDILSVNEKKNYIRILRAQLSNPELYILYFSLVSRFGKKWNDKKYVEKYELIKNIPSGYCGENYDHKEKYKMEYEDDEL